MNISKSLLLTLLVLSAQHLFAQKFTIKGQVADTLNGTLPAATVVLLNEKDSSLVNFNLTDKDGNFIFKNVARSNYTIKVTFMGYSTYTRKVTPPEGDLLDLGKLKMEAISQTLDEVTITAERAPVVVKKDTIEFNAAAFKTKENATVEDLLKRLPGVEVDNDGKITAHGEEVKKVTVDGKTFFANDPKLATRNLSADAIEIVQLFDKKSDQSTFTGIDDGEREKTINLQLKESKRNAAFGNVTAGAGGPDDRYMAKANLNKFSKGKQMSFLGAANNVNDQGFGLDDYNTFTGGGGRGGGLNIGNRGNGRMTSYAGGLNYNNSISKKTDLNASYFYNYLDHEVITDTYRENSQPSGNYIYNANSQQNNTNNNHRINLTLDHKIDSANSFKLTSAFTYNTTDAVQNSTSNTASEEGELQNDNQQLYVNSGNSLNSTNNLLLRHRFQKKGRTLSANLTLNYQQSDRDGDQNGITHYYLDDKDSVINRITTQDNTTQTYGANFSYTEPLGGRKYLEVAYNIRKNLNDSDKEVYDVTTEQIDTQLTNKFNSDYQYQRAGLNLKVNRDNYSITVGGNFQHTDLIGHLRTQNTRVDKTFENILPSARFNYEFSSSRRLRFDYETSMGEPSIQQLQPVPDASDPLNISVGNPDLRPSYQQNLRMAYMTFDQIRFVSFFVNAGLNYTTNPIVSARSTDENLVTTTMPVNVDHSMNYNTNANMSFPITKLNSRFNVGLNWRNSESITLLNEQENHINQRTLGSNVRYTFQYKESVNISLMAQLNQQKTMYKFDTPDQTFLNQSYSAETNLTVKKFYQLSANLDYMVYSSNTKSSSNQSLPMLNASVSRFFFKNKAGELKFSVNNVLDRALGINQTAGVNYFERTTTNSLGRYFIVSFTYALNKQLNMMNQRGPGPPGSGPRMRMRMD